MNANDGILAVWNDCRAGGEADYEAWYRGEHLRERVGLPGFISGRRYVALDGSSPRYFTFYETASPEVMATPVYLERGANPTPMTTRIMETVFHNMTRTVCRRIERIGDLRGAVVIAVRVSQAGSQMLTKAWPPMSRLSSMVRGELWAAAEPIGLEPSVEEKMRGGDAKIGACFVAEFACEAEAKAALSPLRTALDSTGLAQAAIGTYRLICSLEHADIVANA